MSKEEEIHRKIAALKEELSKVKEKVYHQLERPLKSIVDIGFDETQNKSYRKEMEDGHAMIDCFRGNDYEGFFAVYDGHGGREAVEYIEPNFHKHFIEGLEHSKNVKDAFVYAYKKTDYGLKDFDVVQCGSTSVTCFLTEVADKRHSGRKIRKLYTANCGDARAVLSRNGVAQRLSYDHKGSDKLEKKRVEASGGFIMQSRVGGILAVTRSFGDHGLKKWVVCDPFYSEVDLQRGDDLLIVACDGIWDVIEDQEAIELIRNEKDCQAMASLLLETALNEGSTDNISVIVVRLKDWEEKKKKKKNDDGEREVKSKKEIVEDDGNSPMKKEKVDIEGGGTGPGGGGGGGREGGEDVGELEESGEAEPVIL